MVSLPGARAVHDLHVWTIASGMVSLSAHVTALEGIDILDLLRSQRSMLNQRFGIDHVTIQIEPEGFAEQENHE